MRLRYAPNSPFVRKVMVVAIETGLEHELEKVETSITPLREFPDVVKDNPLVKIPSMTSREGLSLFDSRVICEYLDSLHDGLKLFPEHGPARWAALRQQALGDGVQDAATLVRYEIAMRPPEKQWPDWLDAQMRKVNAGLDALETECSELEGPLTIGQISVACMLGWLRIRIPEPLKDGRDKLNAWFERFSERPSMRATVPPG